MARPLRLLYENAWYHVMNRGRARITTFHDNDDYQAFINIFPQLHRRYYFEIHAYCLMPNHYHVLIRTPLSNLSYGMRHLNSLYTKYYNRKYNKDGALFRGRYKAILVEADNYLLRVSRYIHLNPVKAYLIKHPDKYRWSSYLFYSHTITLPGWLYTNEILTRFGNKHQKNKYSFFVMEGVDQELESFYRKLKLLPILGSDLFRKKIEKTVLSKLIPTKDIPDYKKAPPLPKLSKICKVVAEYYHVSVESLYSINRTKRNLPRILAIYFAAELSGKKFKFITNFFKNIEATTVSQTVWRINKLKANDHTIYNAIDDLSNLIRNQ